MKLLTASYLMRSLPKATMEILKALLVLHALRRECEADLSVVSVARGRVILATNVVGCSSTVPKVVSHLKDLGGPLFKRTQQHDNSLD